MKVVTAGQIREIDRVTIKDIGISSLTLMERAGIAVVENICKRYSFKKALILCGGGNNGGDGFVIARELYNRGFIVKVILLSPISSLSPDCESQYTVAKNYGVDIVIKTQINDSDIAETLIVDAMFGTGLNKPIKGDIWSVIEIINNCSNDVISVDIPSGISADNGQMQGIAVRAGLTVTFGLPKIGHLLFPGREYCGELAVENIGFPKRLLESEDIKCQLLDKEYIKSLIPKRPMDSNKRHYGHVLIIGGASGKTGAAIMADRAALRSGSGLVTIGVPHSLNDIYQAKAVEEMVLSLKDNGLGGFDKECLSQIFEFIHKSASVILIGPGMGVDEHSVEIMISLIKSSPIPLIIDADGINCISSLKYEGRFNLLNSAISPIILTPHTGEMARLISKDERDFRPLCAEIEADRLNVARAYSKDSGAIMVLKGASTIIASPDGMAYINTTGNAGMASAGSGDVLAGMIASFIGQGASPIEAASLGVYLHGVSGDIALYQVAFNRITDATSSSTPQRTEQYASVVSSLPPCSTSERNLILVKKSIHSLIASDIIDNISKAIIAITNIHK
jgi:NAD(P)H-hydrate epimerase